MTTLKEQTDAKIAQTRSAKPEFMQKVDELIQQAKVFEEGGGAVEVGAVAPLFTLPNQEGKDVVLSDLLDKGAVVITFYRGSWCPYCNLQLRALQNHLPEIHQLGAELVAISPEAPDDSLSEDDIRNMPFQVLSDQDAKVASQFGVAWQVPELLLEHMRVDRQLDLAEVNNGNGSVLPIPATFVLDKKGAVVWRFVDVDYRTRSEPSDIIAALKGIK